MSRKLNRQSSREAPRPEVYTEYGLEAEVEAAQSPIHAILEERGSRYGSFESHSQITQDLKFTMHNSPKWDQLSPSMKEALDMTAHKIGRILNGDPTYVDSWVDITGYNQLVVDELNRKSKK